MRRYCVVCSLYHLFGYRVSSLIRQNDRLNLSFVKDIYVDGRNFARNGCKTAISQFTYFRDTLYIVPVIKKNFWNSMLNNFTMTIFSNSERSAHFLKKIANFLLVLEGFSDTIHSTIRIQIVKNYCDLETYRKSYLKSIYWLFRKLDDSNKELYIKYNPLKPT